MYTLYFRHDFYIYILYREGGNNGIAWRVIVARAKREKDNCGQAIVRKLDGGQIRYVYTYEAEAISYYKLCLLKCPLTICLQFNI